MSVDGVVVFSVDGGVVLVVVDVVLFVAFLDGGLASLFHLLSLFFALFRWRSCIALHHLFVCLHFRPSDFLIFSFVYVVLWSCLA